MDDVDVRHTGKVVPLFGSPRAEKKLGDEELALLVACGATIDEIARLLGRDLEQVYRDLLSLKLALDDEVGCGDVPGPLGWEDARTPRDDP